MINDAEDWSADGEENEAIDELQFDLKHIRKVRPDMAPEDLDTDSLAIIKWLKSLVPAVTRTNVLKMMI